ncbi:MAG: serine/threonine-protein kinase [Planctomycetota bacterium]
MPSNDPNETRRESGAPDARTLVQTTEGIAASVELSIPQHVSQHAAAPKLPGYILAEHLGEGAYGQVWRAWQLRTHKEVAIKVFLQRSGLDWIFLQREVERLTRLDKHPHIVTLLDTNLDEEPPFYVMELVGGGSLQQWVTVSAPADPRRAVRWMTQIADALSYVHGKGMIHCDLKPENILIDERDSIRVVDFGQSRVFTESAASLGSLFYMAPEQAIPAQAGLPVQPDVRWDVYAFGATLYAILTGSVPFASPTNVQRLQQATNLVQRLSQYREMIERDPRPTWDRSPVNPEVRAVIDKCMAPIAAHRYNSIAEVALDLQAIEQKRPVTPLAGNASYRAKKFVQRNGVPVAAVAAVILALIVGFAGTGLMYFQAVQARDEAEQVTKFLTVMLASVDPSEQGKDVSVREVLDQAAKQIGTSFEGKPLLKARVLKTVGQTFAGLGVYDQAEAHLRNAAEIYRGVLGERDSHTLETTNALANIMAHRGDYVASEAHFRATLEIQLLDLGEKHLNTLTTMGNLANVLDIQGRYAEGNVLRRKTLDIQLLDLGEEHPNTLTSMNNLAASFYDQGLYPEAQELFQKTLEIRRRVLRKEHPDTLESMSNLATVLCVRGFDAEGGVLLRETLDIQLRVLTEEHPNTLTSMNNLAGAFCEQGRYPEAEELYQKTLDIRRRVLGPEHPDTLMSMGDLAAVISDQGRYPEAEELAKQALVAWEKRGEPIDVDRWLATSVRGGALTGLGRFDEAEPLLVGAFEAIKERDDVPPEDQRRALVRIIRLYESWDAAKTSKGYAEKAAEWRAKLQPEHSLP